MEKKYLYELSSVKTDQHFYSSWVSKVFCRIEGASGIHCSNHCHGGIEIWYPFSSSGLVEINGQVLEARKGDIFVINSEEIHAEQIDLDEAHQMFIVLIREEFLLQEVADYGNLYFKMNQEDAQKYLRPAVEELYQAFLKKDTDIHYELREKALIWQILYILMSRFSTDRKQSVSRNVAMSHPWLIPVMDYTRLNFMTIQSEAEVCQKFAISKEHFSRTFKQRMGITYNEFLTSIRLSCAIQQLVLTDSKVSDISEQVGFADVRTFIKAFKKRYGITPLQYKKKCMK
ncbi:MAG: AraC family transcriptional regulator [Otoolea sp.]